MINKGTFYLKNNNQPMKNKNKATTKPTLFKQRKNCGQL